MYALMLGFLLNGQKLGSEELKWALARGLLPSGLASESSSARSVAEPTGACLPLLLPLTPTTNSEARQAEKDTLPCLPLSLDVQKCPQGKKERRGSGVTL